MAKQRRVTRKRPIARERRIDVTRLEYQALLDLAERSAEALKRLEVAAEIQIRRAAELQAEIDVLKRAGGLLEQAVAVPKSRAF